MAGVLSLPKALAAAATLCLLATSCGKAPSKGTIQEPRPAESAESLEYMSVHSPPGFAYKGSTVRLVFRPICHSESDCLSASGTLSFNIDGSVLQQDLTFDANLGLYADVTVVSSLSYRAELKSGGLTSSWPPGPGMQEVPTLETKTIDVGFDLPDPVTISEPKWSVPIPTGRGGGQIGIVRGDQGAGAGPSSLSASPDGTVVIPDFANSKLIIVSSSHKLIEVPLDHQPIHATATAAGYVTLSNADVTLVDSAGKTTRRIALPATGIALSLGFVATDAGVFVRGLNTLYKVATKDGIAVTQVVTEPEHDYFRVSQKELARLGPQPTMWRLTGALRNITGAFAVSADDTIAVAVLNDFRPGTMVAIRLNAAGASGPPVFIDAQPGDLTEAPPVAATGSTVFVLDHPRASGAARVSAYDL